MSDLETFKSEAREFLEANAPKALRGKIADLESYTWGGRKPAFKYPESRQWLDMMAERGWTAPTWPKEYGGGGLSKEEAQVLTDEIRRLALPPPLTGFGLSMLGPTLLQFGPEEMRQEHIPKIVRGEIRWCQGYSEPNAGSDLASLSTSAKRDGDYYVVNGQKVWTSYGDLSDWMFVLVRTDPGAKKQAGITFVLVDLETPGIEIRPIKLISGASPFCESYFNDVRVPVKNVVGKVNDGWTVAKALLGHERSMIGGGMGFGRVRVMVPQLAKEYLGEIDGKIADPVLRDRVTQIEMDSLSFMLTTKRNADTRAAGHRPGPESSMFKYYGTELNKRREELMVTIRGRQALGWSGEGFEPEELEQTRTWLRSRGNSIEGGTSEIQLNIIAKQVLGLPD